MGMGLSNPTVPTPVLVSAGIPVAEVMFFLLILDQLTKTNSISKWNGLQRNCV
jgi:hypothetical protein